MRTYMSDKAEVLTMLLVGVTVIAAFVVSCAPCGSGGGTAAAAEKKEEKTELWLTVESSKRGPGPYMRIATEVLTLADGTQVSCVTNNNGLWCKEVVSHKPAATQTSKTFEPAPLRSSAPADLGGLDFGGSP